MARLVLATVLVLSAACDSGDGRSPSGTAVGHYVVAASATCAAARQAGTDRQAAHDTFFGQAHEPLHELAAALEAVDRPTAARLLEAKQAVESNLRSPAGAPSLPDDLFALAQLAEDALGRLAIEAPDCQK